MKTPPAARTAPAFLKHMNKNLKGSAILLSAALVWGLAFVAQKDAAGSIGVFSFTWLRSMVTCVVLLPVCLWRKRTINDIKPLRAHLPAGLVMGVLLMGSIYFQQWGLEYTTAGKSGFITALYMMIVPIISLFFGKKPMLHVIFSVVIALLGAALLSLDFTEGFYIGRGELLTLVCALLFSFHIIYIDSRTSGLDSVWLCALQFAVCFVLGLIGCAIFEDLSLSQIRASLLSILYVGALSGAVGYTFQIIGQKYAEPTLASIVMCMESVFAAIGGWLIGGEIMTGLEYLGCGLMLSGSIIAQLPAKPRNRV